MDALVDRDRTILQYAVTACDPSLRLRIVTPFGDRVTLGTASIEETVAWSSFRGRYVIAYFSPATSNSLYFEAPYLGNSGNYQTIAVGANDVCEIWADQQEALGSSLRGLVPPIQREPSAWIEAAKGRVRGDLSDKRLRRMRGVRTHTIANTYVETAACVPLADPEFFPFAIGADRLNVRSFRRG